MFSTTGEKKAGKKVEYSYTSGTQSIKKQLPHADYPISHGFQLNSPFMEQCSGKKIQVMHSSVTKHV